MKEIDEEISKLPEKIDVYTRRFFGFSNITAIEYSKQACFFNLMEGRDIDPNDLYFIVFSDNPSDTIRQAWTRIRLPDQVRKDFSGFITLNTSTTVTSILPNGETRHLKPFNIIHIWNMEQNIQHFAVVSTDFKQHYRLIPDAIESTLAQLKKGGLPYVTKDIIGEDFDSRDFVFSGLVYLYTDILNVSLNEISYFFREKNMRIRLRDDDFRKDEYEKRRPDFFICHDSRDKESVAKPLYQALEKRGLDVWYDEYSLEIGDSLTESIERGIRECKYGLIILSKNFISNETWAKNELQSFMVRQTKEKSKVLLPIWHNITEDDLASYSFWLLDKLGGNTSDGLENLADKLLSLLKGKATGTP